MEYALTDLGLGLLGPVCELARWTIANAERIEAARRDYAARNGESPRLRAAGGRGFSGA